MEYLFKSVTMYNQYIKFKLPILKDSYLIKWNPESHTIIHDHNGKDCDFMMLNRNVLECRYQELDRDLLKELVRVLKQNKSIFCLFTQNLK